MGRVSAVMLIFSLLVTVGDSVTNNDEAYALNVLFSALGIPSALAGWTSNGGDPCTEKWKGVTCVGSNITELHLSNLNLKGGLGYALDRLTSLTILDVSNNQLAGGISFQLPPNVQQLILSNNQLTGGLPYSLAYMSRLEILDISNNQLSLQMPDIFQKLVNVEKIDISNNNLTGDLPPSFKNLKSLHSLNLKNNQLGGTITVLATLPLKDLDISNNNFTGQIPPGLASLPYSGYFGNHFNISTPAFTPAFPPSTKAPAPIVVPSTLAQGITQPYIPRPRQYLSQGQIVGIVVAATLTVLFGSFVLVLFACRSKGRASRTKHQLSDEDAEDLKLKYTPVPECLTPKEKVVDEDLQNKNIKNAVAAVPYTFGELQMVTNNFSQENLIGEGTSARVYKGKLGNGKVVAVKKLDSSIPTVHEKDFFDTLTGISRLRHANITELVGYCIDNGHKLLVYDYVSNGTLHEALHSGEDKSRRLSWNIRIKIALGAARALEYLHEICQPMVVHRNFKSSNILLDEDFNPYVADCGLLPLTSFAAHCQVPAQHMGSFGYSAPEYAMSGMYSAKSDVYSFGVMMLELLTGRKPLDSSRPRAEQSLVRWASSQLNDIDALSKMVDPALKGMYPAKSLSRFADVIAQCVQPDADFRPPMSEVVQSLVRLLQRAAINKRRSCDEIGFSQRIYETQDAVEA